MQTVAEVVAELGGHRAVADLVGSKGLGRVFNWIADDQFPAHTYLVIKSALRRKGLEAPDALWRMLRPAERR